jgi:DNA ligase-1
LTLIKTLYGLDKKGEMKVWSIQVEQVVCDNDEAIITICHGKLGGKVTKKVESITEGKQGRNAFQQAELEALARVKKQEDKNYRENKSELQTLDTLAMLAADFRKQGHRMEYPCYGSVKYDGVRALAKKRNGIVTIESRTSQLWDVPHLTAALTIHMEEGDIWDGEIYVHGQELQDIVSAVKRTDTQKEVDKCEKRLAKLQAAGIAFPYSVIEELDEARSIHVLRPKLQFHIFDFVSDKPFSERVKDLDSLCGIPVVSPHIQITEYFYIADEADMKVKHKVAVGLGYEGIMLRNFKGMYESGKRSADLQKYKEFLDSEFLILDVLAAKDDGSVFAVRNDLNDMEFCVTLGSMAQRAEFLTNKELYIGKSITVQYQTRYKGTLLPQFPTGVAIRDYE